ncbi:hypothetical protein HCN44_001333 [Aphidius gifuensis]|uniref:Odorant receptor n=1 Tax=Aphidius gifuensis TaxID=684658 RepID=A0A835CU91_APHGI|nr:hypothetical protein HCN44_001333 [Aphidius gifuensis]
MLILTISQSYFQIYGAILARSNVDLFLETIPNILVDFSVAAKVVNCFFNSKKMKKLLITLEKDWIKFKSEAEIKILNEHGVRAKKMTLTYFSVICGTITPFMLIPLVPIIYNNFAPVNGTLPKQMLYAQYDYLFNLQVNYYPVLIHSYIATFAFINDIIAIDTMCMFFVQHGCALFSIIG